MVKTYLLLPTTFLLLWLSAPQHFNLHLTSVTKNSRANTEFNTSDFNINSPLPRQVRDKFLGDDDGSPMGLNPLKNPLGKESGYKIKTIVIDAGHGGRDGGCSGANSREKEITLSVAKKVKTAIQGQFPDMRVIMTRDKDVFIPLHKRAKIANQNGADLFLSIHCNYIRNAAHIHGSESYVLGLHKAEENLAVAKRENEVVYLEEDYQTNYGFDPNSPAGHILLAAYQNANLEQSILFAEKIEKYIKQQTSHKSRGVRQAGFYVLRETTMPSVLLETGYLSNAEDEAYLLTHAGQKGIVDAIVQALTDYKYQMESEKGEVVRENIPPRRTTRPQPATNLTIVKKPAITPPSDQTDFTPKSGTTTPKVVRTHTPVASAHVDFRVQLAASQVKLNLQNSNWTKVPYHVDQVIESGMYKYQVKHFHSFAEAKKAMQKIKASGFGEGFIVAYQGTKKINIQKARRLTGE